MDNGKRNRRLSFGYHLDHHLFLADFFIIALISNVAGAGPVQRFRFPKCSSIIMSYRLVQAKRPRATLTSHLRSKGSVPGTVSSGKTGIVACCWSAVNSTDP